MFFFCEFRSASKMCDSATTALRCITAVCIAIVSVIEQCLSQYFPVAVISCPPIKFVMIIKIKKKPRAGRQDRGYDDHSRHRVCTLYRFTYRVSIMQSVNSYKKRAHIVYRQEWCIVYRFLFVSLYEFCFIGYGSWQVYGKAFFFVLMQLVVDEISAKYFPYCL